MNMILIIAVAGSSIAVALSIYAFIIYVVEQGKPKDPDDAIDPLSSDFSKNFDDNPERPQRTLVEYFLNAEYLAKHAQDYGRKNLRSDYLKDNRLINEISRLSLKSQMQSTSPVRTLKRRTDKNIKDNIIRLDSYRKEAIMSVKDERDTG